MDAETIIRRQDTIIEHYKGIVANLEEQVRVLQLRLSLMQQPGTPSPVAPLPTSPSVPYPVAPWQPPFVITSDATDPHNVTVLPNLKDQGAGQ